MKIGILTFHDADNYGAVLQAYALKEQLKTQTAAEVEIINYKMPFIINNYKLITTNNSSFRSLIKSFFSSLHKLKSKIIKKLAFNSFRKQYMNISPRTFYQIKDIAGYDAYVVGSDQVWNQAIVGDSEIFFLNFAESHAKKIAYAASIGTNSVTDSEVEFIKKCTKNLDAVAVRESSATAIVEQISAKPVTRVLDPTLVSDPRIWNRLSCNYSGTGKYILVYMLPVNEQVLVAAGLIAQRLQLPVWVVSNSHKKNKYGYRHIRDIGPGQFIDLCQRAEFIVTNSFHGTAFSIIFNKNFITIPHAVTGARMTELLELLQLDNRLVKDISRLDNDYELEIDYTQPAKILQQERQRSVEFLRNALADSNVTGSDRQ